MSLAKGFLGALGGAGIGGALWVGVAYATGWEMTLLAIVVGGAAGFGMGIGNKGRGGIPAGLLAAVAALVCILGAKVGVAHMVAQQWLASEEMNVDENDAREAIMDRVYMEYDAAGVEMNEPDEEDGYPPEVWHEADRRWHAMSLTEREDFRAGLEAELREGIEGATGVATIIAFLFGFRIFDLVCLGLALSTAFKGGSTRISKDGMIIDADEPQAQAPAIFRAAGVLEEQASAAVAPAPVAKPVAPAAVPTPKAAPQPTGLGIFSMLGQEPVPPAASMLPDEPAPHQAPTHPPAAQQVGLINLDFDDERQAA